MKCCVEEQVRRKTTIERKDQKDRQETSTDSSCSARRRSRDVSVEECEEKDHFSSLVPSVNMSQQHKHVYHL